MKLTFTITAALTLLSLPWWPSLSPVWVCFITCIVFFFGMKTRWWWLAGSALGLTWLYYPQTCIKQRDPYHFKPKGYYNHRHCGHPFYCEFGRASD
ncbi:hypothetical protein, partial [Salinivibrio socompensis]|uniref:hypothetical protein n=1 Tax=Salinivibrio socompensis TaxID=1510206 RepID=UPI001969F811